jgi:NADH-quinone oxidoreductase subunit G
VLRVLGNLLELDGFDQNSSEQVRDALSLQLGEVSVDNSQCGDAAGVVVAARSGLQRIASLPLYAADALVRRAEALQKTPDGDVAALCLNSTDAAAVGLATGDKALVTQGGASVKMKVIVSDAVAEGAAVLSMAIEETLPLGAANGSLTVSKV